MKSYFLPQLSLVSVMIGPNMANLMVSLSRSELSKDAELYSEIKSVNQKQYDVHNTI